jgi:hypothetical protein
MSFGVFIKRKHDRVAQYCVAVGRGIVLVRIVVKLTPEDPIVH